MVTPSSARSRWKRSSPSGSSRARVTPSLREDSLIPQVLPRRGLMPPDETARRVLVTGGAGFVGASLAVALKQRHPDQEILALDNLRRRGSELNLARLEQAGVALHPRRRPQRRRPRRACRGSTPWWSARRSRPRWPGAPTAPRTTPSRPTCSAPGTAWSWPGATARRSSSSPPAASIPSEPLQQLAIEQTPTRFALKPEQPIPGASEHGIAEDFPLTGARTLYGATKLAAELLIEEYRAAFGLTAVVNRCGVIAGPWQMGKAEQGVFAHWVLAHPPARTAALHRLRGPPGPRPAPRRRPGRPARRPARPPGALGRRHGQRRGRSGELALAARGDRALPGASPAARSPVDGRATESGPATSPSTSPTAAASTPTRTGARAAARAQILADIDAWAPARGASVALGI